MKNLFIAFYILFSCQETENEKFIRMLLNGDYTMLEKKTDGVFFDMFYNKKLFKEHEKFLNPIAGTQEEEYYENTFSLTDGWVSIMLKDFKGVWEEIRIEFAHSNYVIRKINEKEKEYYDSQVYYIPPSYDNLYILEGDSSKYILEFDEDSTLGAIIKF